LVGSALPTKLVEKLFQSPMTLPLNMTGNVKRVDFSSIATNMRLFGD
jgi:hypothetical protein